MKVITATESLHLKWQILYLFIMVKKINENTLNTELCILSAEMYSYMNYSSINLLKQQKKITSGSGGQKDLALNLGWASYHYGHEHTF